MAQKLFNNFTHIHFIGIGGIGISAIARMFLLQGKKVSGSDAADSKVVKELREGGAKIYLGHAAKNIPKNTDLVIYTIAITENNPELVEAKKRKIKLLTYPQTLHEISKDAYTIAISGTHGKTTTTAMIAKMMIDAGLDPTVIVGSFLKDYQSNFIAGKSNYFIVEACEYRKSFLNIQPTIALVTNIDNDHLDFYKDITDIQNAFGEFISQVPKEGYVIAHTKNKTVIPVLPKTKARIIDSKKFMDDKLSLKVPGKHHRENASLVLGLASILGIDLKNAKKSLADFVGTWRRFEYKGKTKSGAVIYDDYGHHPTEVKATLSGAREFFGKKKIIVVFQPHLYSRTKALLSEFATAFTDADEVLVAPIYAAREQLDPSITSDILVQKMKHKKAISLHSFEEIEEYLSKKLKKNTVVITMGAGDIYKVGEALLK